MLMLIFIDLFVQYKSLKPHRTSLRVHPKCLTPRVILSSDVQTMSSQVTSGEGSPYLSWCGFQDSDGNYAASTCLNDLKWVVIKSPQAPSRGGPLRSLSLPLPL